MQEIKVNIPDLVVNESKKVLGELYHVNVRVHTKLMKKVIITQTTYYYKLFINLTRILSNCFTK